MKIRGEKCLNQNLFTKINSFISKIFCSSQKSCGIPVTCYPESRLFIATIMMPVKSKVTVYISSDFVDNTILTQGRCLTGKLSMCTKKILKAQDLDFFFGKKYIRIVEMFENLKRAILLKWTEMALTAFSAFTVHFQVTLCMLTLGIFAYMQK